MHYYIGLDNGGTNVKACIFTQEGEQVAIAQKSTPLISTQANMVEIDMNNTKAANLSLLKEVMDKSKIDPSSVSGIAICGHGKGLYLVAKDGSPCRPGILSADTRAQGIVDRWNADGTAERIYKKTYQKIMAPQAVALLTWLKENEPESLENLQWIFECKDYVRYILTGVAKAELTDYSGANLVNLDTRGYDQSLLDDFGLGEFMPNLPPLVSSTDFCGGISAEVAAATGLREGTPVYGGMFDIDACAIAVHVADTEHICMIGGTWCMNEFLSEKPIGGHKIAMNSIFCDPRYYLEEESSPTAAVNLEWWVKKLMPEFYTECKAAGKNPYQEIDRMVESVPDGEFYPVYFPFIMASNHNPYARSCFIGMSYYQERKHLLKSIFEGVVFAHRYHLEKLLSGKTTGTPSIRLAGGSANSRPWVQMYADITQIPVETVSVTETGTLGCAMCVGVACGDYPDYESVADKMSVIKKKILPDPSKKEFYDKRFALYKKLLDALDDVWLGVASL